MVETVVTVERTTTTQTTAPAGGGGGLGSLRINIGYFQTVPGIIKLVQFVSVFLFFFFHFDKVCTYIFLKLKCDKRTHIQLYGVCSKTAELN